MSNPKDGASWSTMAPSSTASANVPDESVAVPRHWLRAADATRQDATALMEMV